MARLKRVAAFVSGAVLVGLVACIALTWNSFPGGWIKNRLGMDWGKERRAQERGREFATTHPDLNNAGKPRIVIRKSERKLTLFLGEREAWTARVGLGGAPEGHKAREGDRRTPEGNYTVCTRNANSRFHLFLGLSYPNADDAERGFRDGVIAAAERDAVADAIRAGRCPPWKTALGGEVGIHGSGSSRDWTLGCIALDDPDIEFLWNACPLGTPVRIEP